MVAGASRIFVGDVDRGDNPLSYAWEYYGEDYDRLHSSYLLNGECKPPDGEPPYAPIDGLDGYDNEWGRRILPLLARWDSARPARRRPRRRDVTCIFHVLPKRPGGAGASDLRGGDVRERRV